MPFAISAEALGTQTHRALLAFAKRHKDLRGHKTTDAPAFIASKCKNVSAFEKSYTCVVVTTVSASLRIEGLPKKDVELLVSHYTTMYNVVHLGTALFDVYRCCHYLAQTYFS